MNRSTAKRLARRFVGFVLALNLIAVASPAMAARSLSNTPSNQTYELDGGSWSSPRVDRGSWASVQPNSGSWSGPRAHSGSWS